MKLDNWLSQRAQSCPDRGALIADGAALTYAELEHEATAAARRLAARGARRGATVALTLPAGLEYVVLVHALMKLGAVAYPVNTRLTEAEVSAELARTAPVLTVNGSPDLGTTEADLPLLGEHDLSEPALPPPDQRHLGHARAPVGLTYGNHLWSAVGSAFNLGVEPTDRWLCCLPLFHVGGLSIVMRSVIYGTTAVVHDGFDVDRIAALARGRRGDPDLGRADAARAAAGGRGRPAAAARGARRRRAGACRGARGGARARRDGGPDLRADRDRLAGDDAGADGGRSARSAPRGARC